MPLTSTESLETQDSNHSNNTQSKAKNLMYEENYLENLKLGYQAEKIHCINQITEKTHELTQLYKQLESIDKKIFNIDNQQNILDKKLTIREELVVKLKEKEANKTPLLKNQNEHKSSTRKNNFSIESILNKSDDNVAFDKPPLNYKVENVTPQLNGKIYKFINYSWRSLESNKRQKRESTPICNNK